MMKDKSDLIQSAAPCFRTSPDASSPAWQEPEEETVSSPCGNLQQCAQLYNFFTVNCNQTAREEH